MRPLLAEELATVRRLGRLGAGSACRRTMYRGGLGCEDHLYCFRHEIGGGFSSLAPQGL